MKLSVEKRQKSNEVLNSIYQRCWEDDKFKNDLISNPQQVLKEAANVEVNFFEGANKVVVEDQTDPSIIYLNIPQNREILSDIELTEEELELVSGGAICAGICIGIAIVIGAVAGYLSTSE